MTKHLRTFDVFDTALTRLVGRPSSLFLLLGHRLVADGHWPHSAERFAAARADAEEVARRHVHPGEVTLSDVYRQLCFAHCLAPERGRTYEIVELRLEREMLRAVPTTRAAIEAERACGNEVAFISDFYGPRTVVRDWLMEHGLAAEHEQVWVSSESGLTKASGALFKEIERQRGHAAQWQHFGDHRISDLAMPIGMGISAFHREPCALSRYESQMEAHCNATGGVASLLSGSARWLRLSHPAVGAAQRAMRDIAAGVAGPVLWGFVVWTLLEAKRSGLKRLWFMARDGQVLLRIARLIAPHLGVEFPMGYLYGGRQVVHLAGLHEVDDRAIRWMTGAAGVVSASALLERVGLSLDQVAGALNRHGIPTAGPIGWDRFPVLEGFFRDPEVKALILDVAKQRREDMVRYFTACGLVGGEACGVVDIGWHGSVLRSLFDIIGSNNASRHRYLYFGLYSRPSDVPEASMSAYCFDVSGKSPLGTGHRIPSLTAMMEVFCQADHAQIIHVDPTPDGFRPRLRPPPVARLSQWDVAYFQDCVQAFAANVRVELVPDPGADLRVMSEDLLRTLVEQPSLEEATTLASFQFIDDQSGTTAQPLAEPYGIGDLRAIFRLGKLPSKTLAWWEQGAWKLTPRAMRVLIKAVHKLGRIRRSTTAS